MKSDRPLEEKLHQSTLGTAQRMEDRANQQICCRCFKFIQGDEPNHADEERLREELFCSLCQAILAGSHAVAVLSPASPLPKLSLLVQTEAKYQGQLQALKQQQDLLLQQQELLRTSKQAQVDHAAKERQLARERRRQFQMVIERRKREEELKYLHFAANREENQDGSSHEDAAMKAKQNKRIVRQPHAGPPSLPPATAKPATPTTTLPELDAGPTHEQMQQQQRNKQRLLTVGCYAQDLTPLVNGNRPKRLPMAIPSVYVVDAKKKPQRQPAAVESNRLPAKAKTKKTLRLHPLGKSASAANSSSPHASSNKACENENQQQEEHELSISVPRYRSHAVGVPSAPLTAEIKPAAWIYELGKDVMNEDDRDQSPGFARTTSFAFDNNLPLTLTRLTSVPEELDRDDDMEAMYQSHTKLTASGGASTASSWEYSTERLTSLLEKYKVSVITTMQPNSSSV